MKTNIFKKSNNFNIVTTLLPIFILTSIVPLIMILKIYSIPTELQNVMAKGDYIVDLYNYYKMILISITGMYMTISLAIDLLINRGYFRFQKLFLIPTLLIIILSFSTFFSPYKSVVIWGLPERFEGFFVIYTYLLVLFYIPYKFQRFKTRDKFQFIYLCMAISSIIVSLIGIFEYHGIYLIETDFFKNLVSIGEINFMDVSIKYSFGKKTLASTLYNPNYFGSYIVMVFFSTISILNSNKRFIQIISLFSLPLLILTLFYSSSTIGYIAIILSSIIFLILITIRFMNLKKFILFSTTCLIILSGFFYIQLISSNDGFIQTNYKKFSNITNVNNPYNNLESLMIKDNTINLIYRGETLKIFFNFDNEEIIFSDDKNNAIMYDFDKNESKYSSKIKPYNEIILTINKFSGLYELKTTREPKLNLVLIPTNSKIGYLDYYGNVVTDNTDKVFKRYGFYGYEMFASNRGYIWSLSIPLLKDNIILGSGSDTYPLLIPQDDLVSKLSYFLHQNALIDKPHNLYLQLGITQGVLFTLMFVGLVVYLIIKLIRDLFKYRDKVSIERIAIMCAVIGYMIAGMANDSTVGTGPVFWSLLGISILHYIDDKESLSHH